MLAKGTSRIRLGSRPRRYARRCPRSARDRTLVVLALALAAIPLGPQAMAQSAVDVEIQVGYDGRFVPGRWLPVTVLVESSQAVAGDLELTYELPDGNTALHSMAVEVPGGGRKQFDMIVPAPPRERRISAALVSDDDVLGAAALTPVPLRDNSLAGFLGEPPQSLDPLTLEPSFTEMIPVPLAPERLSLGSAALETLSYVVADADALEALAPDQRDTLMDWTVIGGRVVVMAEDPSAVAWPEPASDIGWGNGRPTADHVYGDGRVGGVEVGMGEVLVARGSVATASRSMWEAALRPAPIGYSSNSEDFFNDFGPSAEGELFNALRGTGNLQLSWFVGFLAVYLILVGPVNYLLLKRRGRKEFLWVTIPFLALMFSGVAYGLARGSRGGTDVRTAGVVFADAYGQKGRAVATVSSGSGGTRTFSFPTRAAAAPSFLSFFGNSQDGSTRVTQSGADVSVETAAFSIHVVRGAIEDFDGHIEATARPEEKGVVFEVTNRTPHELTDVLILYNQSGVELPDMAPGESVTSDIFLPDPRGRFRFRSPMGGGLKRALVGELRSMLGPSAFATPLVTAVIEGYELDIALEGDPTGPAGRFMVVSPVGSESANRGGRRLAKAGRVNIVSVDGRVSQYSPGTVTVEGFQNAVFSYQSPAGVDPDRISGGSVRLFARSSRHDLLCYDWSAEEWVAVAEVGRGARVTADVPAGAFSDSGEVFFRITPKRHGYAEIFRFEVEPEVR